MVTFSMQTKFTSPDHITNCFLDDVENISEDIHFPANAILQILQGLRGCGVHSALRYTEYQNLIIKAQAS